MSMQEREKEILVHRDVLLAEQKAIEDERHRIAIELAERKNKVKNLRIKYESLVQKARKIWVMQMGQTMERRSTLRPIMWLRHLKNDSNCSAKGTSSVAKLIKLRRN